MQKAIEIIDDAVKQIHENDNKTRHLMEFKDGTCVKAHPDAFNNDIGINICKDICKDTECSQIIEDGLYLGVSIYFPIEISNTISYDELFEEIKHKFYTITKLDPNVYLKDCGWGISLMMKTS